MADPARRVLLVAGRLGMPEGCFGLRALLDRLAAHGFAAQLLSVSHEEAWERDDRIMVCPGLARQWYQPFAIRRLRLGETLQTPELIHVLHLRQGLLGIGLAEHWRIPYVQSVDEFPGPRDRLRLSRRWCRRLVAASDELAAELTRAFGVPAPWVSVVAPGVIVRDSGADQRPGRAARVPVVGTAGPIVAASGFTTFLGAARRVIDAGVDCEFVIAGNGDGEVDLRRRADRLRIADRVTFAAGPLVGPRFWGVLDVYCQTALAPTIGRTLALAMAAGVPAIATDLAGLRDLVEHDVTGLRVPPDDSAALARAILAYLHDPERAKRLAACGQDRIRREFDPQDEARALAHVYEEVLESRAHAGRDSAGSARRSVDQAEPPGPAAAAIRRS